MMLSIVIPVLNEEALVEPIFHEVREVLMGLGKPWEVIFVDDGSTDGTPTQLRQLSEGNKGKLISLRLSRNFGQSAALAAGIDRAQGEVIVTMDGDGQNDPKDIPALLELLLQGYDVVCGWRQERRDGLLRVKASVLANKVVNAITGIHLHDYGCTLRLYRRSILQDMQIMGDMHRLLPAYLAWRGARITERVVHHRSRQWGRSKYGILSRTFRVLLDAFLLKFYFSYFTRPMYFFGVAAFICLILATGAEGFVVFRKFFLHGIWLSPLFFLGLFFASEAMLFLFLGALADLMVRNYVIAHAMKPYHLLPQDGDKP